MDPHVIAMSIVIETAPQIIAASEAQAPCTRGDACQAEYSQSEQNRVSANQKPGNFM